MKTSIPPAPPEFDGGPNGTENGHVVRGETSTVTPSPRTPRVAWTRLFGRYRTRLVAGVLAISLPIMATLVLTQAHLAARDLRGITDRELIRVASTRADDALYEAKEAGRDRTVRAS